MNKVARILVVDDIPANVHYVLNLLKTFGVTPVTATGGKAALKALAKQEFDIVILDFNMPEVDGFAVAKEIRAKYPNTFIAGYTADQAEWNPTKCKEFGINQTIQKPAKLDELRWLISRLNSTDFKVS